VVLGTVGAELVQQQEGIQLRQLRRAYDPGEPDAGAIGRGHAAQHVAYLANPCGHGLLLDMLGLNAPPDAQCRAQSPVPQPGTRNAGLRAGPAAGRSPAEITYPPVANPIHSPRRWPSV